MKSNLQHRPLLTSNTTEGHLQSANSTEKDVHSLMKWFQTVDRGNKNTEASFSVDFALFLLDTMVFYV